MNTPEGPDDQPSEGVSTPRWMILVYWAGGLLVVHNVVPWRLSLLSTRYGWVEGRPGLGNLLSLALNGVGLTCVVWTMCLHFVRTSRRVAWERTPSYLLIRGPYKFTRNPMFLGELLLWFGWALFYGSVVVFIVCVGLWVIINFIAVPREERDLEARFGEAYREYKRRVPRWLGKPGS